MAKLTEMTIVRRAARAYCDPHGQTNDHDCVMGETAAASVLSEVVIWLRDEALDAASNDEHATSAVLWDLADRISAVFLAAADPDDPPYVDLGGDMIVPLAELVDVPDDPWPPDCEIAARADAAALAEREVYGQA